MSSRFAGAAMAPPLSSGERRLGAATVAVTEKNMRIVAGKYRSRVLRSLRGLDLRPTSDKLRETLFNILGSTVEESVFLDVYAGTGAVGIEALSRGASEVFFIEKHVGAAN